MGDNHQSFGRITGRLRNQVRHLRRKGGALLESIGRTGGFVLIRAGCDDRYRWELLYRDIVCKFGKISQMTPPSVEIVGGLMVIVDRGAWKVGCLGTLGIRG